MFERVENQNHRGPRILVQIQANRRELNRLEPRARRK